MFLVPERGKETISDELDILLHQVRVHANKRTRERIREELDLNIHRLDNNPANSIRVWAALEVAEEEARKVRVHALVAGDEFVGEGEAGHEPALLQPEDRGERAGEEDALDGGEGDEALGKGAALVGDPVKGPVGLLLDAGDGLDGVEEVLALGGVFDVRVDEEGVCLGVDVLPIVANDGSQSTCTDSN